VLLGRLRTATGHEESPVASLPSPLKKATLALVGVNNSWPSIPSPNYSSRRGAKCRLILFHTAEGAQTRAALGSFFSRAAVGASSHTGIDDTGITRYVPCEYSAWTARNANPVSIQAELCAFSAWSPLEWTRHPGMLENAARWLATEAKEHGIPLVRLIGGQTVTGTGVATHHDITIGWRIGSHTDCGNSFPIDAVIARARQINAGTDELEELMMATVDNPYANGGKGGKEDATVALGYMEQRIREGIKADLPALVAAAVKAALADTFASLPPATVAALMAAPVANVLTVKNDGTEERQNIEVGRAFSRAAEAPVAYRRAQPNK
jgi:hypothetical protein